MHSLLRSFGQTVKGLTTRVPRPPPLQHPLRGLPRRTSTQYPCQPPKDFGLPNPSWSPEMMKQFEKLARMAKDGSWQRLPSYNNYWDSIPALRKIGDDTKKHKDACLFLRNLVTEGLGFEFAVFFNALEKQVVVLLQPGPYLEGMVGFMHGGAVAAILDHAFAVCVISVFRMAMTAHMSVNHRSLIPLGSVVLVETKVEKVEKRKIFMSGRVQSAEKPQIYAEATALFIQQEPKSNPHLPASSK